MNDFRLACRRLLKTSGLTVVAIVTLALGIGANTAIFSLVNTALFRPVHADKPQELVSIFRGDAQGHGISNHPYADYVDYRQWSGDVLEDLAAYTTRPANLAMGEGTERINVGLVSDNYFKVLRVPLLVGRDFRPEENEKPDGHHVALVSEGLWRRHLGATRDLRDQAVWLNDARYAVIGVAPEAACRMAVVVKTDVFVPAVMQGTLRGDRRSPSDRRNAEFMVLGRRRPGVGLAQVQARFDAIAEELAREHPDVWMGRERPRPLTVISEGQSRGIFELRGWLVGFASLLMGTACAVLLVACANLANLLLARGLGRGPELGLRAALGASRWRLIRPLLTESAILAVLGGVAGVLLAVWFKGLFAGFAPNIGVPLAIDLTLDHRVLLFAVVVTLATVLAFGLAPALHATDRGLVKEGQHTQRGSRRISRLRNQLVIGQTAVSIILLACAGLFIRSFNRLQAIDLGFRPDHLALLSVDLATQDASPERRRAFVREAVARLQQVPGVALVDVASRVPLDFNRLRIQLTPEEHEGRADEVPSFGFNNVGPRYFDVMGTPFLRGRAFTEQDGAGSPPAAIVNDALARRFWPGADPIGKRLHGEDGRPLQIVGVVKTGKYDSFTEDAVPFVYLPLSRLRTLTFHVRSRVPPATLLEGLRRELLALDARIAVFEVKTMEDQLAVSLLPIRFGARLLGILGALALGLAALGLYGVVAYFVSQRTAEIGIRMALGAQRGDVLRWVMNQGLRTVAWGAALGLAPSFGLTIAAGSVLYGVRPADLAPLAGVISLQAGIALLACWMPARRAARLDPAAALRRE